MTNKKKTNPATGFTKKIHNRKKGRFEIIFMLALPLPLLRWSPAKWVVRRPAAPILRNHCRPSAGSRILRSGTKNKGCRCNSKHCRKQISRWFSRKPTQMKKKKLKWIKYPKRKEIYFIMKNDWMSNFSQYSQKRN